VVFDDTLGQGEKAQLLRAAGKPVVGGTPYTDRLEDDRSFGQEELKAAGVSIIPYEDFDSFDLAIDFVKKIRTDTSSNPAAKRKTSSAACSSAKKKTATTFVRMLEAYKKAFSDEIKNLPAPNAASNGVEVAVGAFFNGKKFVTPVNHQFSNTKNFSREVGPPTGREWAPPCFGASQSPLQPHASQDGVQAHRRGLRRLRRSELYREQQRNLSFGIHLAIRLSHHQHSAGSMLTATSDFFWELATGVEPKWRTRSGFQIGIRIVVPPFPF